MFQIDPIQSSNRYDIVKFMKNLGDGFYDSVDSKFLLELGKIKTKGTYTVVAELNQPSLLSENIYGEGYTQYWWILMYVNGLRSMSELTVGKVINYPSINDLETLYFSLSPEAQNNRFQPSKTESL